MGSPNIYAPPTPPSYWQEDACAKAYATVYAPSEVLAVLHRRPLFPPRLGYQQGAVTVQEVLRSGRNYPDNLHEFSGGDGGFAGTTRNSGYSENPW